MSWWIALSQRDAVLHTIVPEPKQSADGPEANGTIHLGQIHEAKRASLSRRPFVNLLWNVA
jgi:hypothetical protein